MNIIKTLKILFDNEKLSERSLSFIPSENSLSSLARLPLVLDAYNRYFLDDLRTIGKWSFNGGRILGKVEKDVLEPLLKEMSRSKYINTRPISGMTCTSIILSALCEKGDNILLTGKDIGGHSSIEKIANTLGIIPNYLPIKDHFTIDYEKLTIQLKNINPSLIYIGQSSTLFPIEPSILRDLVNKFSPNTIIHYDSSHLNGLILNNAIFNPLETGAHVFGGSTHKTLPGPHKGFLATDDKNIAKKIQQASDHLLSHHHMADIFSLTITLLEMKNCNGDIYAQSIIKNTKLFAKYLYKNGVNVCFPEMGFTDCHQIWVNLSKHSDVDTILENFYESGLIINNVDSLLGINGTSLRLSLSEITRFGIDEEDIKKLAMIFSRIIKNDNIDNNYLTEVKEIKRKLNRRNYCYNLNDLNKDSLDSDTLNFIEKFMGIFI